MGKIYTEICEAHGCVKIEKHIDKYGESCPYCEIDILKVDTNLNTDDYMESYTKLSLKFDALALYNTTLTQEVADLKVENEKVNRST